MCVAVPGRVVSIEPEGSCRVEVRGRTRGASTLLLPDVKVGDYVLLSSGMIVERLSEEEALARFDIFDQLLEALDGTYRG